MGHYRFQDMGMAEVQRVGNLQVEECNEIWSDVMSQINALFPEGEIDAGLAGVLNDRNEQYQRDVQGYMDDLGLQNTAVGRTREIAAEGGEAMRRAASL
ncbi:MULTISPECIES: hypothetical protein [unclassified Streptomyces]|uniref:hypothetical protein n=1 Tax=unclassified Streptomyces TaxID=2593676 RepID=UPI0022B62445|nr:MULTISPECIES: hypothetical protein [unclassified Streptomyces]MCZ7413900.1 hypothetical protein [Streptomyces sp. WMMC897]MCZ7430896.1 hypothetical protein [Streptomyces sp. WMMC1477]